MGQFDRLQLVGRFETVKAKHGSFNGLDTGHCLSWFPSGIDHQWKCSVGWWRVNERLLRKRYTHLVPIDCTCLSTVCVNQVNRHVLTKSQRFSFEQDILIGTEHLTFWLEQNIPIGTEHLTFWLEQNILIGTEHSACSNLGVEDSSWSTIFFLEWKILLRSKHFSWSRRFCLFFFGVEYSSWNARFFLELKILGL